MEQKPESESDPAQLRWLFIDLNAFFASAEQQMNPEWRGRPVIVRPAPSEFSGAIAASYESRPYGIRTGTSVREARQLCPDIIIAEARPDVYVKLHKQIMAEIERHIPIYKIGSIDECSCELMGPQRREDNAVALARRIQKGIRDNVGECLRSSVGLAPSRFLAKTACGMQKPDGLTILRMHELPGPLLKLPLSDFPGIGKRMLQRLRYADIHTTADLWNMSAKQARHVWNSIEGERIWRGLHGLHVEPPPEKPPASIGHSHVLQSEMRTPDKCRAVARRLLVKCGARLRRMDMTGSILALTLELEGKDRFERRRGERVSTYCHIPPTQDTFALLAALDTLWVQVAPVLRRARPNTVGVHIDELKFRSEHAPDLFNDAPDQGGNAKSLKLSKALDVLNKRYGKDTVSIGPSNNLPEYMGAKIAFNRIPEEHDFWE
ncbi:MULTISPECIES: Y-family DNA polymerase [unclassified Brevundimonas]|uniref:Y-family DNA polymerase n=1 Tax=unclassified Brevundimonas TaxID=2622653 RepID=UPI0025BA6AC5|nr:MULTISPECIES: type VI secretion protein ImpB [unclassified Brevundimonas]